MQDSDSLLRQYGAKYGLIFGAVLLVIGVLSVYSAADLNLSAVGFYLMLYILPFLLKIIFAVVFALQLRKTLGGYWTLKQATTGFFFMFYMAFLISFIGNDIVFSRLIDPATVQKANNQTVVYYRQAQQIARIPQKELDARVKDMQAALNVPVTPGIIIAYLLRQVMILFLVSLVFGAIFKREQPAFKQQDEEV